MLTREWPLARIDLPDDRGRRIADGPNSWNVLAGGSPVRAPAYEPHDRVMIAKLAGTYVNAGVLWGRVVVEDEDVFHVQVAKLDGKWWPEIGLDRLTRDADDQLRYLSGVITHVQLGLGLPEWKLLHVIDNGWPLTDVAIRAGMTRLSQQIATEAAKAGAPIVAADAGPEIGTPAAGPSGPTMLPHPNPTADQLAAIQQSVERLQQLVREKVYPAPKLASTEATVAQWRLVPADLIKRVDEAVTAWSENPDIRAGGQDLLEEISQTAVSMMVGDKDLVGPVDLMEARVLYHRLRLLQESIRRRRDLSAAAAGSASALGPGDRDRAAGRVEAWQDMLAEVELMLSNTDDLEVKLADEPAARMLHLLDIQYGLMRVALEGYLDGPIEGHRIVVTALRAAEGVIGSLTDAVTTWTEMDEDGENV